MSTQEDRKVVDFILTMNPCQNQLHGHACKREGSAKRDRVGKTLRAQSLSELSSECHRFGDMRGVEVTRSRKSFDLVSFSAFHDAVYCL